MTNPFASMQEVDADEYGAHTTTDEDETYSGGSRHDEEEYQELTSAQVQTLIAHYQKIKHRNSVLKKAYKGKLAELEQLQSRLSSQSSKSSLQMEQEVDRLQYANTKLVKQCKMLQQEVKEERAKKNTGGWFGGASKTDLEKYKAALLVARAELDIKIRENEHLHGSMFDVKEAHEATLRAMQDKLHGVKVESRQLQEEIEGNKRVWDSMKKELNSQKDRLKRELQGTMQDLSDTKRQLSNARTELMEETARLEQELEGSRVLIVEKVLFHDTANDDWNCLNVPARVASKNAGQGLFAGGTSSMIRNFSSMLSACARLWKITSEKFTFLSNTYHFYGEGERGGMKEGYDLLKLLFLEGSKAFKRPWEPLTAALLESLELLAGPSPTERHVSSVRQSLRKLMGAVQMRAGRHSLLLHSNQIKGKKALSEASRQVASHYTQLFLALKALESASDVLLSSYLPFGGASRDCWAFASKRIEVAFGKARDAVKGLGRAFLGLHAVEARESRAMDEKDHTMLKTLNGNIEKHADAVVSGMTDIIALWRARREAGGKRQQIYVRGRSREDAVGESFYREWLKAGSYMKQVNSLLQDVPSVRQSEAVAAVKTAASADHVQHALEAQVKALQGQLEDSKRREDDLQAQVAHGKDRVREARAHAQQLRVRLADAIKQRPIAAAATTTVGAPPLSLPVVDGTAAAGGGDSLDVPSPTLTPVSALLDAAADSVEQLETDDGPPLTEEDSWAVRVITDDGSELRHLPVGDADVEREREIRRFYEERTQQYMEAVEQSEANVAEWQRRHDDMVRQLETSQGGATHLQETVDELNARREKWEEERTTLHAGYQEQLKLLNDHLLKMGEMISGKDNELSVIKSFKVRCGTCRGWNQIGWLMDNGNGKRCRFGAHPSSLNYAKK